MVPSGTMCRWQGLKGQRAIAVSAPKTRPNRCGGVFSCVTVAKVGLTGPNARPAAIAATMTTATGGESARVKAPTNPIQFTGQYLDSATGLYHLRARQYDPSTGRFLTLDPLAPTLTDPYVAAYVYVNSRPTVFVDPSDMGAETDVCDPLSSIYHYDPVTKRFSGSVSVPCVLLMPTRIQTPSNDSIGTCFLQTEFNIVTCPALAMGNDRLGKKVDPYWEYAPGIHGSEGPIGPCRYSRRVCRALAIAILSTLLATTACYATGCDPESAEPQEPPFLP
jgi:RHS repeat-associated protein